ncbi:MAG: dTDP-4-amino-4,6-dideoxygalactose transaminase [Cyclobacteriaceae bacterium]|nr:dTDP-4-amino-4,6-dideoxygalactose transaminase [Cyclobacteriaceae bacterium]
MSRIGFNKPYFTGKEINYIMEAVKREKISGNGHFTQLCHDFIEKRYGIRKVLLTTSCTDALEMAALLINTRPGDEIIMPSYTFVSTANAFVLRGATVVFADSSEESPNIDVDKIEALISKKTKAIVVVHYAGFSCDMDKVMAISSKHNLYVIEDTAQAIESTYKNRPLGSIGHLGCFSFHETKNIISGEGGALLINDPSFIPRAEIIWEKGTNRSAFFKGEVDKYGWIDVGSSFLPSEITAAFLYAQLEKVDEIQARRLQIWNLYYKNLKTLEQNGKILLPSIPEFSKHNAHIFYLVCKDESERDKLIIYLDENGVDAIFHYLSLHKSPFYINKYRGDELTCCDRYSSVLLRLPIYFELSFEDVEFVCSLIHRFFKNLKT